MGEAGPGTVTFLFTDIEGSTRLWEEHPDAMAVALEMHDGLLGDAVATAGGRIIKSTGDGAFAGFASPPDGLAAAVAAQVAITGADWPDEAAIRVRMGLHAGVVSERGGDYFGPEVNRAARVMS